jgi:hypothetical protein
MGSWHVNDLTSQTGAPAPAPAPASIFAGYAFEAQGTQHVVYRADGDIQELWWDDNGWHHHNLTQLAAHAQPAAADGNTRLAGYALDAQGIQHVVYRGIDNHIYDMGWYPTVGWYTNDLTGDSGAPPAAAADPQTGFGGDPVAYVFEAQGTQHVMYRGADNHIYELWASVLVAFNGEELVGDWGYAALTKGLGAPPAAAGSLPCGYAFNAQNTQHVMYLANTLPGPIFELWWDFFGWHYHNVSEAAGAPEGITGEPSVILCGYAFEAAGTQHVFYASAPSAPGLCHQLYWDHSGWRHNDLSSPPVTPPDVRIFGPYAAYVFNAQNTQHVIAGAINNIGAIEEPRLYELWGDFTGWHANDLSSTPGVPAGVWLGNFTGDAVAAYAFNAQQTQHVIARGVDSHIYELWWG